MTFSAILQFYLERKKKEGQREKRKPLTSQLLYLMILQEFTIVI